jgi:hypothetical protein
MRAKHDVRWLRQLELLQRDQTATTFEIAAIKSLTDNQSVCHWLGNPQVDALERWSIGLGMLLQNRQGRPEDLSTDERRHLAATGFDVTIQGRTQLDTDIDAALGRYQIRLSKTWVHSWAFQSAQSPERHVFRQLMKDICSNQGRFSLINVCKVSADEHFVNCEIVNIARSINRSKTWVRRTLRREKLLPASGIPQSRDIPAHMRRCRSYISAVVDSLDATKSAARLNIGIKGFESLVEGHLISPMKNRGHKCDRFIPSDLDQLLAQLDKNLIKFAGVEDTRLITIADACFLYHLTTAQMTRLLVTGLLPSSQQMAGIQGFLGIRVERNEVVAAMKVFTDDQIAPRALSQHLGLTFDELRSLRELRLLPSFPAPAGHAYRSKKSVGKTVLARFLGTYQTVTTAARLLGMEKNELRLKISRAGIQPAKEGAGLPIYYRSDLID